MVAFQIAGTVFLVGLSEPRMDRAAGAPALRGELAVDKERRRVVVVDERNVSPARQAGLRLKNRFDAAARAFDDAHAVASGDEPAGGVALAVGRFPVGRVEDEAGGRAHHAGRWRGGRAENGVSVGADPRGDGERSGRLRVAAARGARIGRCRDERRGGRGFAHEAHGRTRCAAAEDDEQGARRIELQRNVGAAIFHFKGGGGCNAA